MKFLFGLIVTLLPSLALSETAEEIIGQVEKMLAPQNVKARYVFTNHRLDGSTAVYEVGFSMRDPATSHGIFVKPEREKGREVLRLGDDLWTYVPGVGRIVRIADRDSFAGGDFSNADVLRVDWLQKYKVEILKDLTNQWIIALTAKNTEAPYATMRVWVDKKTHAPVQQHYYDSQGTMLKRCLYGEVKTFSNLARPARLVMENVITKQKSELDVLAFEQVASFPPSRFVVDNLGKAL